MWCNGQQTSLKDPLLLVSLILTGCLIFLALCQTKQKYDYILKMEDERKVNGLNDTVSIFFTNFFEVYFYG